MAKRKHIAKLKLLRKRNKILGHSHFDISLVYMTEICQDASGLDVLPYATYMFIICYIYDCYFWDYI